jgi:hypothetical protein
LQSTDYFVIDHKVWATTVGWYPEALEGLWAAQKKPLFLQLNLGWG